MLLGCPLCPITCLKMHFFRFLTGKPSKHTSTLGARLSQACLCPVCQIRQRPIRHLRTKLHFSAAPPPSVQPTLYMVGFPPFIMSLTPPDPFPTHPFLPLPCSPCPFLPGCHFTQSTDVTLCVCTPGASTESGSWTGLNKLCGLCADFLPSWGPRSLLSTWVVYLLSR